MDIPNIIKTVVNRYGTSNPYEIADARNIIVKREELGHIFGYHNYCFRQHFIHINWNLCDELQRYTCAHELGHAILHEDANVSYLMRHSFFCPAENQANAFAAGLLTYGMDIEEGMTIQHLAALCGIPPKYAEHLVKLLQRGC